MFMVLPAAVLFATVFSIGSLTRHAEITAAKASGVSFYRMVAPIFFGAGIVTVFALVLGELVPVTNAKRNEILEERRASTSNDRFNFAYEAQRGRVYQVTALNVQRRQIDQLEIERKGSGPDYPTYLLAARSAQWDTSSQRWTLMQGDLHIIPDSSHTYAVHFDSLRDNHFTEPPADLTLAPRSPEEMRYRELSRFIAALERSGGDVPHHRHLRRAACHEHAARRRGVRDRYQPRHYCTVPDAHSDHQGNRRRRRDSADHRCLAPQRALRTDRRGTAGQGPYLRGGAGTGCAA
jgi:lipopolysaccharide export system permease protein